MEDDILETTSFRSPVLRRILLAGGVGILPTDTMYGVVGSALNPATVERIYKLRDRQATKPMIVLIGDWMDLKKLGVTLTRADREKLEKIWPGAVSVVLPCKSARMKYLHRGGGTLAVRWPALKTLTRLINQVGPLVAPSANQEGAAPATTIDTAKKTFGDKVDFYVDWRTRGLQPSTLIKFERGKVTILREGKVRLNK